MTGGAAPNASRFRLSGESCASHLAEVICCCTCPISVRMPVAVTMPAPWPLATVVPANSMFAFACSRRRGAERS